jgi:hypothetical protein
MPFTMPLSTDVRLPKSVKPVFPPRCVYSGESDPDAEVVVLANSQSAILSFLAPILLVFGWRRVRAPISRKYRARFYLQSFGRDLLMLAFAVVGVFVFMPMFGGGTPFRKLKVAGLVLAALSPWILFEVFFPRRFDVTARGEWIDYEFASAEYADEFAALNESHVIRVQ